MKKNNRKNKSHPRAEAQRGATDSTMNTKRKKGRARFASEALEPRILLSATWVDSDTGDAQAGAEAGNDTYTGTEQSDSAEGLGGNDSLYGLGGQDSLRGGAGNDLLDGGTGDDELHGNEGDDTLIGGGGNDQLWGDAGNDTIRVTGAQNGDRIQVDGGSGTDTIDLSGFYDNQITNNGSTIHVDNGQGLSFDISHEGVETILTGGNAPPANHAPDAVNDAIVTNEDTPITTGNVLANDTDADGNALSITGHSQGAHGTVVNNNDGTFTYAANANYSGSDSFTYTVSDGAGGTDTATINVTVNAVNDAPTAVAGADQIVNEGSTVTLSAAQSSDPDVGDGITYTWRQVSGPAVTLSDTHATNPTFAAPNVTPNTTLRFEVTVSDGESESVDTVDVVVKDPAGDAIRALTYTQFGSLTAEQVDYLTPEQIATIPNTDWMATMSAEARGSLDATQVQALNTATISIGQLTPAQREWLTTSQIQNLTYGNFRYVPVSHIPELTTTQLATIPNSDWFNTLSAEARNALTHDQIRALGNNLSGVSFVGGSGNDTLTGNSNVNKMLGGDGIDTLSGGEGTDVLDGGVGNDTLTGGGGRDLLIGGGGDDVMSGGAGDDTFAFEGAAVGNVYTIDGGTETDTLDLRGFDPASITYGESTISVGLAGGGSFTINHQGIEAVRLNDGTHAASSLVPPPNVAPTVQPSGGVPPASPAPAAPPAQGVAESPSSGASAPVGGTATSGGSTGSTPTNSPVEKPVESTVVQGGSGQPDGIVTDDRSETVSDSADQGSSSNGNAGSQPPVVTDNPDGSSVGSLPTGPVASGDPEDAAEAVGGTGTVAWDGTEELSVMNPHEGRSDELSHAIAEHEQMDKADPTSGGSSPFTTLGEAGRSGAEFGAIPGDYQHDEEFVFDGGSFNRESLDQLVGPIGTQTDLDDLFYEVPIGGADHGQSGGGFAFPVEGETAAYNDRHRAWSADDAGVRHRSGAEELTPAGVSDASSAEAGGRAALKSPEEPSAVTAAASIGFFAQLWGAVRGLGRSGRDELDERSVSGKANRR